MILVQNEITKNYFENSEINQKVILLNADILEKLVKKRKQHDYVFAFDCSGYELQENTARRLGRERCSMIDLDGAESIQELFNNYGLEGIATSVANKIPYPIEGMFSPNSFYAEVDHHFKYGYPKTAKTGFSDFDNMIRFFPRKTAIWTGISSHGKSNFIDQVFMNLSKKGGQKFAIFSPEHDTSDHLERLIEIYTGKTLVFGKDSYKMTWQEKKEAQDFINEHFKFIIPKDELFTLDKIYDAVEGAVVKYGVNGLVIDPWNMITHKRQSFESDGDYIARAYALMKRKAREFNIHQHLVAHPTKLPLGSNGLYMVPTAMNISGSANWYNMSDIIMVAYRRFGTGGTMTGKDKWTEIYCQKRKQKYMGKLGVCKFTFNNNNQRFTPLEERAESEINAAANYDNEIPYPDNDEF